MKIDFLIDTAYGTYCHCLNLPDDHEFTDDEIAAMKQGRVDKWISAITAETIEPGTE